MLDAEYARAKALSKRRKKATPVPSESSDDPDAEAQMVLLGMQVAVLALATHLKTLTKRKYPKNVRKIAKLHHKRFTALSDKYKNLQASNTDQCASFETEMNTCIAGIEPFMTAHPEYFQCLAE